MWKVTPKYAVFPLFIVALIFLSSCSMNEGSKEPKKVAIPMVPEMSMAENQSHDFKIAMNKLWEDHFFWTRSVILCLVDGAPGADQAIKRLMQNQNDIGDAVKPYYGEDAGNRLTELLKTHIAISADVVKSAKSGDTPSFNEANIKWYANANEISAFLSKANPNWVFADMMGMMNDHLKLTTEEAVQRIKKDYDADVVACDKAHLEILKMSAMLADGIIKQFPEKIKVSSSN